MKKIPLLLTLILAAVALGAPLIIPQKESRRLEVLFFGAPTRNHAGHDPITRYRVLKKHLGDDGINLTYIEDPAAALNAGTLQKFDAILMYGNWASADRCRLPRRRRWSISWKAGVDSFPFTAPRLATESPNPS